MTDTIWIIIRAIVAAVGFAVGFRIAAKIREWRDNTRNIEREIPFSLFLEAYGKAPDRWKLLPYYVRYGADDVRFENYADYSKYKKWREKRKRDAEAERKRSMNERLFREIQSDIMPKPPTTGSCVIRPKPKITIPEFKFEGVDEIVTEIKQEFARLKAEEEKKPNQNITIPKLEFKEFDEEIAEKLQEMARIRNGENGKQDDEIVRVNGAKLVPQPAEFCGDCPLASWIDPDVVICGIDRHAHLRSEWCKYRKQAVLKPMKAEVCGICGKCRQFDKGDNSTFGYCFRNDEIVNEASVKGCFEPKSKAEERPEPLGTVTTH